MKLPVYKKIIFVIIFFGMLFLSVEIVGLFRNFRFDKNVTQFYVPMLADRKFVLEDEELFWKFKPSVVILSRWTYPSHIKINSEGFRSDSEYSEKKEEGVKRIACIGNSVTFGYRRSLEESFEYVLESKLNGEASNSAAEAGAGKKFEVYNFGVPGYTSHQGLIVLKRNVLKFKPDYLTLCFGINDERLVSIPDKIRKVNIGFLSKFEPYYQKLFTYKVFMKLYYDNVEYKLKSKSMRPRVSLEDYEKNLDDIIEICKKNNIVPIIITPPYNPTFNDAFSESLEKYRESALKIAEKNNCPAADFSKNVTETFKTRQINYIWDSCHPDVEGNIALAEMIRKIIVEYKPSPSKK